MYNIDMVEANHGREFMNKVKLNLFYAVVPGKIFVRMFSSTKYLKRLFFLHFQVNFPQKIPLDSFMDFSVINYIKSSVVALFSVNPMDSVNPMSVKVMHHCTNVSSVKNNATHTVITPSNSGRRPRVIHAGFGTQLSGDIYYIFVNHVIGALLRVIACSL